MGSLNVTGVLGHLLPAAPVGVRYEIRFNLDHYYVVAYYGRELAVGAITYKPRFWRYADATEPEQLNKKNVCKAARRAVERLFGVILVPPKIDRTDEQRKKLGL